MKYWQVDSFTARPFAGNPAGVCVLHEALSTHLMQQIAAEVNLSETAFVELSNTGNTIRWFTPKAEVNLCGHATLAAAHVLWSNNFITSDSIEFSSRSGALLVTRGNAGDYTLNFPQQYPVARPELRELAQAIVGDNELEYVGSNGEDCLLVLRAPEAVTTLNPDPSLIMKLPERGVIVSSRSISAEYDFHYRTFYPKLGIPEDPVTGSACTALGPYWSNILGRHQLRALQCSARGGQLTVSLQGDRVLIGGHAVTVLEGELLGRFENPVLSHHS